MVGSYELAMGDGFRLVEWAVMVILHGLQTLSVACFPKPWFWIDVWWDNIMDAGE